MTGIAHDPSADCTSAGLAGRARAPLAVQLERGILGALAEWGRIPYTDLVTLAPEGREIRIPELEGEQPFGYDSGRGSAYDAGPSGKPDTRMLADVIGHLQHELLIAEDWSPDTGRAFRLYDPEERIGLGEIAERLRVRRDTADHWRARGVLPETGETEGRRPRWPWRVIRAWAFATGRNPGAPNAPRWNGRNGPESGVIIDAATGEPIEQRSRR